LLGFGNVNRTLVRLLVGREAEIRARYGIEWRITGIASRKLGWIADCNGLPTSVLCAGAPARASSLCRPPAREASTSISNVREWLQAAQADVLFEATSLNVEDGQPAVGYIRAALEHGAHAITANKGAVVYAYDELSKLAAAQGKRFLFESTVMDGVPIFSLFRDSLPTVHLRGFRGILNSTTNLILSGMEEGLTFDQSLAKAQALGVAETDASYDIDGWDAAVKVSALVNALMGVRFRPSAVQREGIRNLSAQTVRAARCAGKCYKLVCRAARTGETVEASVRPELVLLTDPMAQVNGTSSIVYFETDIFPELVITENNPGLEVTAYGMLADFVRAVSEGRRRDREEIS
jgi:homoserine dehydrogenase